MDLTVRPSVPSLLGLHPKSDLLSATERAAFRMAMASVAGHPIVVPLFIDGVPRGHLRGEAGSRDVWHAAWSTNDNMSTALAAGQRLSKFWVKNPSSWSPLANKWFDLWPLSGDPQAGSYTGTAATARQIDSSVAGGLTLGGNVSTNTKHIVSAWATSNGQPTVAYLYDRVLTYEACTITGGLVSMTNTLAAQRYIAAGQHGLLLMPTVQTTVVLPGSSGISALVYVDQGGTSGQAAPMNATTYQFDTHPVTPTTSVPAQCVICDANLGQTPFLPLAAGDSGVRSVTSYTTNAAATSGTFCLALVRPLVLLANSGSRNTCRYDYSKMLPCLPIVYDGAHVSLLAFFNGSAAQTMFQGAIDVGWG